MYIVCQLLTKEENERLRASFQALDKNCDGKITKEELLVGFKKIYSHLSEKDLLKETERAFARADLDGDGFIDYSEWQISCVNKDQVLKKERLIEAFKHFDTVIIFQLMYLGWRWKNLSERTKISVQQEREKVRELQHLEADNQGS